MDKTTKIFNGKAMGVEEQPDVEQDQPIEDTRFHGLEPINFDDKVMGGENSKAFLAGKTSSVEGPRAYEDRLTALFKTPFNDGVASYKDKDMNSFFKMSSFNFDNPFNSGGFNMKTNKDNSGFNAENFFKSGSKPNSTNPFSKINSFFAVGNMKSAQSSKNNKVFDNLIKTPEFKGFNNTMNISFNKKINTGFNKNIGTGFNKKINPGFGFSADSNTVMKRITGNNNPERVAKTRLKQQKNLPMFGDFDGDKLVNILDCDPLDPNEQGNQHDLNQYMEGENPQSIQEKFERNMGTSKEEFFGRRPRNNTPSTSNIQNIDNKLQETERRLSTLFDELPKTTDPKERTSKAKTIEQLEKTRRALIEERGREENRVRSSQTITTDNTLKKDRFGFEKQKYYDEKEKNSLINEKKYDLDKKRFGLQEESEKRRLDLQEKSDKRKFQFDKKRFGLQEESEKRRFDLQEESDKRKSDLENRRISLQQGKNDRVLFEKNLKYGSNVISGVVGGFGNEMDFSKKTGALSGGMTPTEIVQQPDNISMFNTASKFDESLGPVNTKSFGTVVGESLGIGGSAQPQMQPQIQQPEPQMQPQIQQPEPQMQQPEPQARTAAPEMSDAMKNRFARMGVDWSKIQPEEAARIDPEYARYLKESKGETTYRRGPYKK